FVCRGNEVCRHCCADSDEGIDRELECGRFRRNISLRGQSPALTREIRYDYQAFSARIILTSSALIEERTLTERYSYFDSWLTNRTNPPSDAPIRSCLNGSCAVSSKALAMSSI